MTTTTLLPHRHPAVITELLQTLNDPLTPPPANRTYTENERGLENWGWQPCHGELAPNGKRMKCQAGEVRKGKFLYRCGACRGQGGYHGDPYDNDQQTIRQGQQRPSTFTVTDYAELILIVDRDQPYAIDRALWMLETRLTLDTTTSTPTRRSEHPAITQLRRALERLAIKLPRAHGLIRRTHIEQWTPETSLSLLERAALRQAITHLTRLLPNDWCAPRTARERATERQAA